MASTDPAITHEPTAASLAAQTSHPELDLPKLHSLAAEQKEIFLLKFVTALTRHVLSLQPDDCTAQQFYLKKEILQILNLPTPAPTRVIRNNLGKCLAHIFGKGDRKLLFDTINELIAIISSGKPKSEGETRARHASVTCLGDLYDAAGDSATNLHHLACSTLMKVLKTSTNHAGMRAAALLALSKVVRMVASSLDEPIARDIWKQARSHASSDKGFLVAMSACRCLKSLVRYTLIFDNSSDFDGLKSTLFKAFECASVPVRQSAASALSEAMVKGYIDLAPGEMAPPPKLKRSKTTKASKRSSVQPVPGIGIGLDDNDIPSRPGSPAPSSRRSHELALSFSDIFRILCSQYVKSSTSIRVRTAIGMCIGKILKKLGEKVVEQNYTQILESLAAEMLGHSSINSNRYRLLVSRRLSDTVLQDVVGRDILSEAGQVTAAKTLINNFLKNYPQALKERPEPSKHTLCLALGALSGLIRSLGSASNDFADACRDGLLQHALQHPSYTVQIHASACIKTFVLACPQQLLNCMSVCMNSVGRELQHLGGHRNSPRRCLSFAHGLAASLSASPMRPLHGSVEINNRVFTMATGLLKSSGKSELRMASTQIQVAWILISGLMPLGPNFVKIHLSQLLLLWKNALPKPLGRDNTAHRSFLEASFLCHVRECALGSILTFLEYNSRLLTVDVSKRIATMLQSTTAFLRTLPSKKTNDDISQRLIPALQLQDLEMMVQRRVLQCYTKLINIGPAAGSEALLQSNLLTLTVALFADPEAGSSNSLSASIAAAAGTFETIWDAADNVGFGVTSLVHGFKLRSLPGQHETSLESSLPDEKSTDDAINNLILHPVCGTLEHDASLLYAHDLANLSPLPDPPPTEVVNMSIQLFAFVFPLTPPKVQESILEQIATFVSASSLERDPGRKAAINVNVAVALSSALTVAAKETQCSPGDAPSIAVERLLQEMIRGFVIDPDQYVRSLGYGALARLCNTSGNSFTNQEIKHLVDTIVGNREPSARAGCAMALGCIQAKVGGMAAGYHLKTILGILMSLCNDPHPTVHFWALEALSIAADGAGLGFSPFVSGTLGMLAQLYVSENHNHEVASAISMNLEVELSTQAALARCVDSLVNVLGPDLQESTKSRELILTLVALFQAEEELPVQSASLRCYEHLSMYAPGHVDFTEYVKLLQKYLKSEVTTLRDSAVDGLYNLMKRDSKDVIAAAEKGFEDQLWLVLDTAPGHEGIRNVLSNWMRQTCLGDTAGWLRRLQGVLKMTRTKQIDTARTDTSKTAAIPDLRDEEVAGFAAGENKYKTGQSEVEPLRWQVRTFSMSLLDEMFHLVNKDVTTNWESGAQLVLQNKIADVIQMAFSASTSSVLDLRVWGLKIIGHVLKMFGKTPDPDFEEAMLLEQYQAQIGSALTPAFAADSSPELASEAVQVCAAFIATGIVTDVDRMGRILRTLVTAFENFAADHENAGIGDLKGLSSNAQVMVKMSVYSAWADLQVASSEQKYLIDVLKPRIRSLTPRWLDSLKDFARLRFEPDISMTLGPPSLSGSLDTIYAALNRETLLRFYQESWLKLVDAIASLIEQDSQFVFDALDGKESDSCPQNGHSRGGGDINYRDEPVAFFFVLFGIAFEALATRSGQGDSLATHEQTLAILQALKKILRPSVAGISIYRQNIFAEAMELFDRLVLTEGLDVQAIVVEISRDLCVSHPSARKNTEAVGEELSSDIEQLFELTRIIILVFSGLLPNLTGADEPIRHQMTEEGMLLVQTCLNALVDAAEVFPSVIKTDLHACIIHVLATILRTPSCQDVIVPQSLPILKRFLTSMTGSRKESEAGTASKTDVQLHSFLKRMLSIYLRAQRREEMTDLACVKNCLLSLTILFTSGKNYLPSTDALVERYLEEVLDCLTDRMTAKIAANCIRTLLLNQHPTPADATLHSYLLPHLIKFAIDTEPDDPEGARGHVSAALTQYVAVVSPERRAVAMALVFPTLLKRASLEGEDVYEETRGRLLELAAVDQMAFKGIVAGLGEDQRAFFETVLMSGRRKGGNGGREEDAGTVGGSGQPSIALKMDFGE